MRVRYTMIVGLVLPLWAGCAASQPCRDGPRECPENSRLALGEDRPAVLASALLFDPQPGRFDAQEFAQRSDWPSTLGFYSPGQVIYYSERFVDYQGRGWAFGDSLGTYRRAESYKVGVGYR